MAGGESRQELLAWLNGLLQLNVTKVEQCGTGAALCQIYDSIFLDLPMQRVKFNVNAEYAYLENFKILSNTFRKHSIDRPIPVEMLVKCKMQDNLEFLQWTKRYWDANFPGGDYDAPARRKGAGPGAGVAQSLPPVHRAPAAAVSAPRRSAAATTTTTAAPRTASRQSAPSAGNAAVLRENAELKESVVGLERERDFYFSKLRDIELLIQEAVELEPTIDEDENHILKKIQVILYSTEEGFEIPEEADGDVVDGEEETF